jgi:hypothetical protein
VAALCGSAVAVAASAIVAPAANASLRDMNVVMAGAMVIGAVVLVDRGTARLQREE